MHLQAVILFAQEIGKFFAITGLDLLNWIIQWRHNIKILKISAVDLKTVLFLCISIKKSPNLVKLSLKGSNTHKTDTTVPFVGEHSGEIWQIFRREPSLQWS